MNGRTASQLAVAAFVGALLVLVWLRPGLRWTVPAYFVMSLVTALVYAIDKKRAVAGRWRISEMQLHLLDMFFGWPGGLLAQHGFRHKNRKGSYQLTFWLIVILHLAGLAWLATH